MTETIIIVALICVTLVFIVFICASVEYSKYRQLIDSYNKHMEYLDGDDAFISRKEFEEYERMINKYFQKIESKETNNGKG